MTAPFLRRVAPTDAAAFDRAAVDAETEGAAADIVAAVRTGGVETLEALAERFDGRRRGSRLVFGKGELVDALTELKPETRGLLERCAARIASFARAQRATLTDLAVDVEGGQVGHTVTPVERAGCYAPAGRFPLPSTLLMTAVTARAAGVREVVVASPNPSKLMLAAAAIAGADAVLAAGGAHAIAALAYGVGVRPCDVIVGPGSRWVTAGKKCVAGHVAIDMLAGPSELVVVADASANPCIVAADLLAQAEHDPDAFVALVATSEDVVNDVERELREQVVSLPTRGIAEAALRGSISVVCAGRDEVVRVCDQLAPEHLQLSVTDPESLSRLVRNAGACFAGEGSGEVFGDYGAGGNHVLPTGRGARFTGGLSVLTFLRVRTWQRVQPPAAVIADVASLARLEGLEGHARAAERRAIP